MPLKISLPKAQLHTCRELYENNRERIRLSLNQGLGWVIWSQSPEFLRWMLDTIIHKSLWKIWVFPPDTMLLQEWVSEVAGSHKQAGKNMSRKHSFADETKYQTDTAQQPCRSACWLSQSRKSTHGRTFESYWKEPTAAL